MTQQATGVSTRPGEELIKAGAVTFGLTYRNNVGADNDEGLCIRVYGNALSSEDKELLRFDCFRIAPHYHYRNPPIQKNDRLFLDYTTEGDPVAWSLDKIKNRLPAMLIRCEAEDIARSVEQRDINAAMPKILAWAEAKTHNRA